MASRRRANAGGLVGAVRYGWANPMGTSGRWKPALKMIGLDVAGGVGGGLYAGIQSGGDFDAIMAGVNQGRMIAGIAGMGTPFLRKAILKACFAAGTPLLTPDGHKLIEHFREGDLILSRSEHNPTGPLEAKVVEEVFVRLGLIHSRLSAHPLVREPAPTF